MEQRLFNLMALFNALANLVGAPFMLELPNGLLLFALHMGTGVGFALMYCLARFRCAYERLYWPFVFLMAAFVSVNALNNAASMGGAHYYLIMGVVIAVILARGWRRTFLALAVFAVVTTVVFTIEYMRPEWVIAHASERERWQDVFANFMFVLLITGIVVMVLADTLDRERQLSDRLLLNVLPEQVARELKLFGHAQPRNYADATVLFTDIAGFTAIAEKTSPETLVQDLDQVFSRFDAISKRFGVSRIKTIGDAYMAAGGVPEPNATHPQDVLRCALKMLEAMHEINVARREAGKATWEMRIGVHTGALTGGVVGIEKFAYDLWGDTVNVASRMESNGEPGRINISAATYVRVKDAFETQQRGSIAVKNRGELEMFFVLGEKSRSHDSG